MSTEKMATKFSQPSDLEIVMERVFDAPRELVWKAYTDPKLVAQWWGQRQSTTVVDKMEVKPGGAWRYVEREAGGAEYGFKGEYREVKPPERLVYTFEFEPMPGHIIVDTITFEAQGGQTKVTARSRFDTVEDLQGMLQSGMEGGANESWDRLEELLANSARLSG